jgi:hypothetical protein
MYWLQRGGTSSLVTQPLVAFAVYFGMIHFFMPVYKYVSGNYRYPATYSDIVHIYNVVMSLVVFAAIALAVRTPGAAYSPERYRTRQVGGGIAFLTGFVIVLFACFAMFQVRRSIGFIGLEAFRSDRILVSAQIGAFTRIDTIILPGLALMTAGLLNLRRRYLLGWIVLAAATFYAAQYYAMMQSRNSILLIFLIMLSVFAFYRNRPMRFSGRGLRSWIVIAVGLTAFVWFGYLTTLDRYAGVDHWYAQAALDNLLFTILDGPFGNDENLLWLLEHGHPLYWGQTYLAGVSNLIPRAIWADKPWGAGPEIRNLIYPGSYVMGAEGNSSITTGFLTEAQMNFGLPGIFLVAAIWVWVVRRLVRSLLRAQTVFAQTLLMMTLCFMTTAFVYSEFLGFFSRLAVCLLFSFIVYYLLDLLKSGTRRRKKIYA